jgi:hypothetical protein
MIMSTVDVHGRIRVSPAELSLFCQRWQITELSLFGSVLREDFTNESDVDVLVVFAPEAPWTLFDLMEIEDQLVQMFGREVDLVERDGLVNPYRRETILNSREILYGNR